MAEIIETKDGQEVKIPSEGKVNAGLTLGIIGTALSGLNMLGGAASLLSNSQTTQTQNPQFPPPPYEPMVVISQEEQFLERKSFDDFYKLSKNDWDNKFEAYRWNVDTNRDLNAKICELDKKIAVMEAVGPYRDAILSAKIDSTNATTVSQLNYNQLASHHELMDTTKNMITGNVVLPSTTVTGYPSASSQISYIG